MNMNMNINIIHKLKNFNYSILWKFVTNTYFIFYSSKFVFKKLASIMRSIFYTKQLSSIQFIKNGLIIYELFLNNDSIVNINNILPDHIKNNDIKYDFILYNYLSVEEENKIYAIRYNNYNELVDNKLTFEKSDVSFLNTILVYNEKWYEINLNTKNISYCIENNFLLDNYFIKYYINKYFNFKLGPYEDYTIVILDNACNTINLKKYDYIILNSNDYKAIYNDTTINITEELDNKIIDENSSTRSECVSLSHINSNENLNSENLNDDNYNSNRNRYYYGRYYKYVKSTIDFFNWAKY